MRANRLIGRQVAGRFTITRFLGEGGMATVFVAEQDREPRQVALKIMNEDLNADRAFAKRFQREAEAAARVQHPNTVAFIDYGVADGLSYIAMELLQGDDLYVLLERDGAITQARAARIVAEVCDALMVAHEIGIVHRDLKPENIMVIADGAHPGGERVKVLDFGIAKMLVPDTPTVVDPRLDPQSGVTRAGTFIGTPAYMAPEQCALLPVDTRADIYTCGVLLFQLVTGRLPFEGQTPLHTATLHIHEATPRPSQLAPTVDPRLEAVIMKALAKKPSERHQTARQLATTLRKILPDMPDVKVATVGKPAPGSLRGRTRNSVESEAPPAACTPVAAQGEAASPGVPQVPVTTRYPPPRPAPPRALPRPGTTAGAPPYRPAPPRPAAGAPPPFAPEPADEGPSSASDPNDAARTLVRPPPEDDGLPRFGFGPQDTAVIDPSVRMAALGAPIPPPGPRKAPPPAIRPTLKSATEFTVVPAPPPIAEEPEEPEAETLAAVSVSTVMGIGGPSPLRALPFGAAQPTRGAPGGAPRPASPPTYPDAMSQGMAPPASFDSTTKMVVPNAASHLVSGTAQTVPLISPAVIASAIARGPAPAPVHARALRPAEPGSAPEPPAVRAPYHDGTSLSDPRAIPAPPQFQAGLTAPLGAPPAYPLARAEGNQGISGTRGLLIGFVAGALLMGVVGAVYLLILR